MLAADEPTTYRQWARTYPANEPVDLYGYVQVHQAVEEGDPTLVSLADYLVANGEALAANDPWTLIHGWGQLNPNQDGNLLLNLEGWEISTLESEYLTGTVQRQDGEALFLAADGTTYLLPDLPAEVPAGVPADVAGLVLPGEPAVLDWGYITTGVYPGSYYMSLSCGGGGGGGGGGPENANFGGGNLALPYMDPSLDPSLLPTPTSVPGPYATGDRLEGETGQLLVLIYRSADGSTSQEINFQSDPADGLPYGTYFRLEGEALAGIERYHNLPVRIWGSVTGVQDYTPVVSVERYEPLDPDLQIQEWAGTEQVTNLEGQDVVLFTTRDGQSFVLYSSLIWGAEGNQIGVPGDLIGIEGYIIPDRQLGGYPVIRDVAGEMPPDGVVSSSLPFEYDHAQDMGAFPAETLSGQVTIDRIELVYASITLQHCTAGYVDDPNGVSWLVVQPIWVFSGHFDDGRLFTIQINALPDEYLP